ncbi:MAG: hypothetical protein ACHP7H_00215 [Hyphomicrobiales bacterium]
MADSDATGLQVLDGITTLSTLDVNTGALEWREDHLASLSSLVAVPLLHRFATSPASSLEQQRHRRHHEVKIAAGASASVPTTVAVAQDFLTSWPAPLPRNPFVEAEASS